MTARPRLVFVLAATLVLSFSYAGTLDGDYVWDDVALVERNRSLTEPDGLRTLLRRDLSQAAGEAPSPLYRPLPMWTLRLQASAGAPPSVRAARLGNLALHLMSASALLQLLLRVGTPQVAAAAIALVFVAHPCASEPVMWLSGRHDLLGALCMLLALLCWPRPGQQRALMRAAASAGLVAAAALSKETYLVTPALLGALAWLERDPGRPRRAWLLVLPAAAIAAVLGLRALLGVQAGELPRSPPGQLLRALAAIVARYTAQLATLTTGPTVERFAPLGAAQAALVLGATSALGLFAATRASTPPGRLLACALACFLALLAPHVLSLPLSGLWANRYAYPAAVAAALAVAAVVLRLGVAEPRPRARRLALAAAALLVLVGGMRSRLAAETWHDDLALYGAAVEANPDDGRARYHLGYAIQHRQGCAAAVGHFAEAARLDPGYVRAWRNLAGCLINLGRPQEAIEPARRAVALAPAEASQRYNLALALIQSGLGAEGRAELDAALRLDPTHAPSRTLRARLGD